ncbi:MAG: flagellar type III secretion system protein FliR [Campylobacteraceae bacterium]|nr:flagellar type III secretion system protein FliR [Campylobacteraceae bacterium]
MEIIQYLGEENVFKFVLLFARMSGLVAFFPFFGHMQIPVVVKTAIVFFLTLFLYPYASLAPLSPVLVEVVFAFMMELMLGFISGLMVYLVFAALEIAGQQISFVMGFTMASVIDPQTGVNTPLVGQVLMMLALVVFLAFDGHHLILLFYHYSLGELPLGSFYPHPNMWTYISNAVLGMFLLGFIFSFPVKALSLLSDIIFGMLMKTMPQFNLLVVGFPIKIMLSYVVMMTVLSSIMIIFKKEILSTLNTLPSLFF